LLPGQRLVDVGSGQGIPGVIFGALNPGVDVIGYDIVSAKIKSSRRIAQRLFITNVRFLQQDFAAPEFQMAPADVYYFFNPSSKEAVAAAAEKIISANRGRRIKIVSYLYSDVLNSFRELGFGVPVRHSEVPIFSIEIEVPR
jgi:tRNA A58 N-methylase Trm61